MMAVQCCPTCGRAALAYLEDDSRSERRRQANLIPLRGLIAEIDADPTKPTIQDAPGTTNAEPDDLQAYIVTTEAP